VTDNNETPAPVPAICPENASLVEQLADLLRDTHGEDYDAAVREDQALAVLKLLEPLVHQREEAAVRFLARAVRDGLGTPQKNPDGSYESTTVAVCRVVAERDQAIGLLRGLVEARAPGTLGAAEWLRQFDERRAR
jgi:hypothetical protein